MFGIDDLLLGTLIGGVGSGLISTAGQLYTNKQNLKYNSNVNDINWQIAAQNNATQIDMANTSHQREVKDLQAAGLNPILSAGGSGALTPSLSNSRGDSAQIENPTSGLANSAKALGRYISGMADAELDQAKADVQLSEDQSEYVRAETDKARYGMQNISEKKALEREQLKYQTELAKIENKALEDLAYDDIKEYYGGQIHSRKELNTRDESFYNTVKRGIMSDAALRATSSLRAGIDSISKSVNSAASVFGVGAKVYSKKRR